MSMVIKLIMKKTRNSNLMMHKMNREIKIMDQ